MSDNKTTLEVIAPSVEEAIAKGMDELGLAREQVDIEVLDEGGKGLFGLGSRQARVRISIKSMGAEESSVKEQSSSAGFEDSPHREEDYLEAAPQKPAASYAAPTAIPDDITLHVAKETVSELLDKMKVQAEVTAYLGEAEDARSRVPVHVDVKGNDLSILIGRQAETLNALQYIASQIVSKELGKSVTLVIDVEGYRQRREQQIRQLARRMAEQAISTNRRQVLEPMPANERRLVHIELRDNPLVTTESTGEDPHRKVTIIPK